jgi:hypothetical protein
MNMVNAWPDTTDDPVPTQSSPWGAARWLVGRYPRMQVLCERVGAIDDDGDERWPHIDMLADVIRASDHYGRAWEAYGRHRYAPDDEARYDAWEAAGPKAEASAAEFNLATPGGILAYGPMSGGEKRMLRILAALSPHRVEFSATSDTSGLDDEGHAFVLDWLAIISR